MAITFNITFISNASLCKVEVNSSPYSHAETRAILFLHTKGSGP